ncbi:MAG: protein kinase [Ardenticatenaceae bacterium]|nr:protein kinase [Ardenticatenaceae bacterium]MCB9443174.1 protein kinase [Ardenticatenaceae bacterium]
MSDKKIGRYEIKSELGRGGMATVYLAYDPVLEREVALKLLPNYFAHDPEFSARFEREAKTVAALEHGSIVSMYDYGEDGEWPYFVMRLMKGGSLKDRIAEGSMSLKEAAHIVERVASALDKAHSKEIVHRDLKPGNIMFDEDGEAYLGDFGIVKLAESSESYTRTGNTLGTPAYMSPEQADGNPNIDGRSDIYSLGIILYEMLTGTAPYTHESMPRLLIMQLTTPIPNVLDARADLPAGIQAVIEKAMAKNRDERYATGGEMVAAIQAVLNGGATAVPTKAAPVVETKPEPIPTRSTPVIEMKPEPKAEVATAVSEPMSPPPAAIPASTKPAAKSGGIPKWLYAMVGVVVIAIIGIFALSGGSNPGDAPEQPVSESRGGETAVDAPAAQDSSTNDASFNYFDDSEGWPVDGLIPTDDFNIANGQATFVTRTEGFSWICYQDVFGDGTYEVELTMPQAEELTAGFGLLFMADDLNGDWYEFYLDSDGNASVAYCADFCSDFDILLDRAQSQTVNTAVGSTNKLTVSVNNGSMIFYVNGDMVGQAQNQQLTKGSIGLILYNDIDQDLKVGFDNFTYTP